MDILVLMTAAICHDLDHPGYNNTYVWGFLLISPLKGVPSLRGNSACPSAALRQSCQPRHTHSAKPCRIRFSAFGLCPWP